MGSLDSSISSGLSFVSDFPRGFALRDLGEKRIHFRLFVTLIGSKSDELALGESCLKLDGYPGIRRLSLSLFWRQFNSWQLLVIISFKV